MAEQRNQSWSAARMLEAWGLRTCGGCLRNPLNVSAGGNAGVDENWQAKSYVEGVAGFATARPVLAWVCIEGRDPSGFRIKLPGESQAQALKRLGWQDYVMLAPDRIALEVFRDFEVELVEALADRPFLPVYDREEEEGETSDFAAGGSLREISK